MVGFLFFGAPLSLAAIWLGYLIPLILDIKGLPSFSRRPVRVEIEGSVLRVDGERFHLGRAEQQSERSPDVLTLRNDEDEIVVRGCPAHLTALHLRLREVGVRDGGREDVPGELDRIATAPPPVAR